MASQDDPTETQVPSPTSGTPRIPRGGPGKADLKRYRDALVAAARQLLRSSRNLADEALKGSGQDFSVDHMADHGTDNFEQDFSLALLEGESDILRDIQDALDKIDGQGDLPYGLCEACAEELDGTAGGDGGRDPWIPKGRLDAVPYARLCVLHQERQEESQG